MKDPWQELSCPARGRDGFRQGFLGLLGYLKRSPTVKPLVSTCLIRCGEKAGGLLGEKGTVGSHEKNPGDPALTGRVVSQNTCSDIV